MVRELNKSRPPLHCVDIRGFTLIELIMVLVMVGVLAVFVAPNFSALRGFDEIGYRDKVRGALEFARKAAVAQRRTVQVDLAANNLTFKIDWNSPTGAFTLGNPQNLTLPSLDKVCNVNYMVCAPAGVSVTFGAGNAATGTLVFNALGQVSGIPTAPTFTVTGSSSATIRIDAETGYVY